jgi:hypothetical protein
MTKGHPTNVANSYQKQSEIANTDENTTNSAIDATYDDTHSLSNTNN